MLGRHTTVHALEDFMHPNILRLYVNTGELGARHSQVRTEHTTHNLPTSAMCARWIGAQATRSRRYHPSDPQETRNFEVQHAIPVPSGTAGPSSAPPKPPLVAGKRPQNSAEMPSAAKRRSEAIESAAVGTAAVLKA
eukprot:1808039-Prymnesium_polylepis.1